MEPNAGELLAQSKWIGELAHELVGHRHDAEDLAQEARIAALVQPPREPERARGWFASVLRNLRRSQRRGNARRSAREASVARSERTESHADVLARFETQRMVATAVAQLDEPYRSAILLRYFEGLAPREIAARTSTPVRTVHTHLARGLERLRHALDERQGGDRSRWLSALLPLAHGSHATPGALGVLLVKSKLIAVVLVGVLATLLASLWWRAQPSEREPVDAAHGQFEQVHATGTRNAAPNRAPNDSERAAVAESELFELAQRLPKPGVAAKRYRGRVLNIDGAPLGGLNVRCRDLANVEKASATSGADGWFELEGPERDCKFDCTSTQHVTVLEPLVYAPIDTPVFVVVSEFVRVAGELVDPSGAALTESSIALQLPSDLRSRVREVLEHSRDVKWEAQADSTGHFLFERLPRLDGAELLVRVSGCADVRLPAPQHDELRLSIVACEGAARGATLEGRVVDAARVGLAGAQVALGQRVVECDADGRFTLRLAANEDADVLLAVALGLQPARLKREGAWPTPLEIVLDKPTLSIRGRVLTAEGKPFAGAAVGVADPTYLGARSRRSGEVDWSKAVLAEQVAEGRDFVLRPNVTDASGAFEIGGLAARSYRIRVLDGQTVTHFESAAIEAGSRDVEIVLPSAAPSVRYAGRVVSFRGVPQAGATLFFTRAEDLRRATGVAGPMLGGPITSCDADGRFVIEVPGGATSVSVDLGHPHAAGSFELAAFDDLERLELVCALRCLTVIERLPNGVQANRAEAHDAQGLALPLTVRRGDVAVASPELQLFDGASETFGVPENATVLVLFDDEREVARVALTLDPARLNRFP